MLFPLAALQLRRPVVRALVAALHVAALAPAAAPAQVCARMEARPVSAGGAIVLSRGAGVQGGLLAAAVELWERCSNYGSGFPRFVAGGTGRRSDARPDGRRVTVRLAADPVGTGRCGRFAGAEIVLHRFQREPDGRVLPCGSLAQNLAHELGHVLGLGDARPAGACSRAIMARLGDGNLAHRSVRAEECSAAGQLWLTGGELTTAAAAAADRRDAVRAFRSTVLP